MTRPSSSIFARLAASGTCVPRRHLAFVWHEKSIRTIRASGRPLQT